LFDVLYVDENDPEVLLGIEACVLGEVAAGGLSVLAGFEGAEFVLLTVRALGLGGEVAADGLTVLLLTVRALGLGGVVAAGDLTELAGLEGAGFGTSTFLLNDDPVVKSGTFGLLEVEYAYPLEDLVLAVLLALVFLALSYDDDDGDDAVLERLRGVAVCVALGTCRFGPLV
jgi:hypothetical protein